MKKLIVELIVYFSMFYGFMFGSYYAIYEKGSDALMMSFALMFFGGFFTTRFFDKVFK
jgi:hypothetical protein